MAKKEIFMKLKHIFKNIKNNQIVAENYSYIEDFNHKIEGQFPSLKTEHLSKIYLSLLNKDFSRIITSFNESDFYFLDGFFASLSFRKIEKTENELHFQLKSDIQVLNIKPDNFSSLIIKIDALRNITINDHSYNIDTFSLILSDYIKSHNKAIVCGIHAISLVSMVYEFNSGIPWDWLAILQDPDMFKNCLYNFLNFEHLSEDKIGKKQIEMRNNFYTSFGQPHYFKTIETGDILLTYKFNDAFKNLLFRFFVMRQIESFNLSLVNDSIIEPILTLKNDTIIPALDIPHDIHIDFEDVNNFRCFIDEKEFVSLYTTPLEKLKDFSYAVINLYNDFYNSSKKDTFIQIYKEKIINYLTDNGFHNLDYMNTEILPENGFWSDDFINIRFSIPDFPDFKKEVRINDLEQLEELFEDREEINALLEKALLDNNIIPVNNKLATNRL